MQPTIAIIGASPDRRKFGNKAVRAYARQGYQVFPIHPLAQTIEGFPAFRSVRDLPVSRLDRISVYLPPPIGLQLVEDLAAKPSSDVWFNPGAESLELVARARALGLNVVEGCSIVALGASPADFP